MNNQSAASPAAEAVAHGQSAQEATGAPRAMFYMSASALPMLRGPMVAYAPEDDGGAGGDAGGGEGGEVEAAGGQADEGGGAEAQYDENGDLIEDDDLEDVDFDGKAYKLPKVVRESILRHQDYVKQTAGLADERKSFESQRQQHAQTVELHNATLKEQVVVSALEDAVNHYKGLNWNQIQQEDPVRAQGLWMEYQQAQLKLGEAQTSLDGKRSQLAEAERQQDAARVAEVEATLARDIPGWGPELFNDMVSFAGTHGIDQARLRSADVGEWKILHLATVGAKALKQQQQTQRHTQAQTTKPAAPVKGNAPVRGLSDKSDIKDWMAQRNAQVAKAGR